MRPPPPASTGHVIPSHPRLPSSSENVRSGAAIQVSSVSVRLLGGRPADVARLLLEGEQLRRQREVHARAEPSRRRPARQKGTSAGQQALAGAPAGDDAAEVDGVDGDLLARRRPG